MKKRLVALGGFVISLVCLIWIGRMIEWAVFWQALGNIRWRWLIASTVVFYASVYARALRWTWLFRPNHRLSSYRLFRGIMVGFAFNNLLPSGRVGEVMRAVYIGKQEGTGVSKAFGTIVTERIFDGFTILIIAAIAFALIPPIDPRMEIEFSGFVLTGATLGPLIEKALAGCVILAAGVGALLIAPVTRALLAVIRRVPMLSESASQRIQEVLLELIEGFRSLTQARTVVMVLFYSFMVWGLNAVSAQVLALSFKDVSMSFVEAMALVCIESFCVMIPAAPGYWGLFEAGMIFGFKVLDIHQDPSVGLAYGIVLHLIFFLPTVLFGLLFAAQSSLNTAAVPGGALPGQLPDPPVSPQEK